MALIPKEHEAKVTLDRDMEPEYPRPYLGLSMIGHECSRYLQYYWRWGFRINVSGRMRRLFDAGHDAEARIVEQLGDVTDTQRSLLGFSGHWKGHIDGIWNRTLLEIKTFNSKRFRVLQQKGVKESNPAHYAQMQAYMSFCDMPKKATYVATCKDDSTIYVEEVAYDDAEWTLLSNKAVDVVMNPVLLPKTGTGEPTWNTCRYCDARQVCHFKAEIPRSCRSCVNVIAIEDGKWICGLDRNELSVTEQEDACNRYKLDEEYFDVPRLSESGY